MSFIAGYILGCGEGGDRRIKKLDVLEPLYRLDIGGGWNIRIKIASDIDNVQYFRFGKTHGGLVTNIKMWTLYYCVYLNDDFKYATCHNPYYTKYQEDYEDGSVPDRLYRIYQNTDYRVTSAEASVRADYSFLTVTVIGTFIQTETLYDLNGDADSTEGETKKTPLTFRATMGNFGGSQNWSSYIVNGSADDFREYVFGLYAVCRERALNTNNQ